MTKRFASKRLAGEAQIGSQTIHNEVTRRLSVERTEGEKREGNRKPPTTPISTSIETKRLGTRIMTKRFAISKHEANEIEVLC